MKRKKFLNQVAAVALAPFIAKDLFAWKKEPVYGHNGMRFHMDKNWSQLDQAHYPVNDCHEMVEDAKGRIILLTNETKNNILIYNKDGKLLQTWGSEFPGAHGLTISNENGTEFLYITDTSRHQVYKTTLDGRVLLTIDAPVEAGLYTSSAKFVPTESAVADNGDIFIADGYGAQYILHYDASGKLIGHFGGKGELDQHLDNAHGTCIDYRKPDPSLLVTDRRRNCFKRFSMQGTYLETINLPGACVCRPVIKNKHLYAAVLRSPGMNTHESGFVTILDENNQVVSNLGGTEPVYLNGVLQTMKQEEKIFIHPHDVCVDSDENLYVAQWRSGKVYPYKFIRI